MAKLKGNLHYQGKLDDLIAYTRRDMPGITIIQTKGGPSPERVKKGKEFAQTRKNNKEFAGRAKAFALMYKLLVHLKNANDHNLASSLNSMLRPIQELDTESVLGKRNIKILRAPQFIEGYQLSNGNPLEAILKTPILFNLDEEALTASVELPPMKPGKNFKPIGTFPFYKWVFVFGIVPNLVFDDRVKDYKAVFNACSPSVVETEWIGSSAKTEAREFLLSLNTVPDNNEYCLVLATGIMFGVPRYGAVRTVNAAGAGKILKVI